MKKMLTGILSIMMATMLLAGCGGSGDASKSNQSVPSFDAGKFVNVISREAGSGTRGAFTELFKVEMKKDDGTRKDMTTGEAVVVSKTDVMLTSVSGDPYAIGYVSLGSLNDTVKAISIDGTEATAANIKNGTYKISRPFNIATKGDPEGLAKDFIDFILSADGQAVVANGYIAIDENAAPYAGGKLEGKVVVAGSSSVYPVMEKLKEAYEAVNTNATIELQMSDSTAGMTNTIEGICDIGMASRELKDSEKEQLQSLGIALDGIAVIVSNDNTVSDLTQEQVRMIFTGEATTWSEVMQ